MCFLRAPLLGLGWVSWEFNYWTCRSLQVGRTSQRVLGRLQHLLSLPCELEKVSRACCRLVDGYYKYNRTLSFFPSIARVVPERRATLITSINNIVITINKTLASHWVYSANQAHRAVRALAPALTFGSARWLRTFDERAVPFGWW